jgi:hypothetical protein
MCLILGWPELRRRWRQNFIDTTVEKINYHVKIFASPRKSV